MGTATCQGRPGSKGYEVKDANQYAAWGIDYTKVDWCNTNGQDMYTSYSVMKNALLACGRPIVFSICSWGYFQGAEDLGNLWRTTGDIYADFGRVLQCAGSQVGLENHAGPGHWNDPDMLEVGNGSLTPGENRVHFSLWCILASPLMTGNDLRSMPPAVVSILTNKEAIAVNQDSLGKQATRLSSANMMDIWVKPLRDSSKAVVFMNANAAAMKMSTTLTKIGLKKGAAATVRDLWAHANLSPITDSISITVPGHDVAMLRISQNVTLADSRNVRQYRLELHQATSAVFDLRGRLVVDAGVCGKNLDAMLKNNSNVYIARKIDGRAIEQIR
jgi:alpha-galactosidase